MQKRKLVPKRKVESNLHNEGNKKPKTVDDFNKIYETDIFKSLRRSDLGKTMLCCVCGHEVRNDKSLLSNFVLRHKDCKTEPVIPPIYRDLDAYNRMFKDKGIEFIDFEVRSKNSKWLKLPCGCRYRTRRRKDLIN